MNCIRLSACALLFMTMLVSQGCGLLDSSKPPKYIVQQMDDDASPKQDIMAYPTEGPFGTGVRSIIQVGTSLIAGTQDGIFISDDGGATWSSGDEEDVPKQKNGVLSLAVNGNEIYAATDTGIFEADTVDSPWSDISGKDRPIPSAYSLAYSDSTLFAASGDGLYKIRITPEETRIDEDSSLLQINNLQTVGADVYACTHHGLYRKKSGSNSWVKDVGMGDVNVYSVASSDQFKFASTSKGLFSQGSMEGAWHPAPAATANVSGLLAVFHQTLFTETSDGLRCTDLVSGLSSTWRRCDEGLGNQTIETLVAVASGLFVGTDRGVFKWNESHKKWEESIKSPGRIRPRWLISVTDVKGPVAYAITNQFNSEDEQDGTIYQSQNFGESWRPVSVNLPSGFARSVTMFDGKLYASKAGKVYVSNDRGDSWLPDSDGLETPSEHSTENAPPLAVIGDDLFTISNGNTYLKHPQESSWHLVGNKGTVYGLAMDLVGQPGRMFVVTSKGVYMSAEGQNWTPVAGAPTRPRLLGYTPDTLFLSSDLREPVIWAFSIANNQWNKISVTKSSGSLYSLWIDKSFPNIFVVGTSDGLFWTSDSGQHFEKWQSCGRNVSFSTVYALSSTGDRLMAGTDTGVFYLVDHITRERWYQFIFRNLVARKELFSGVVLGLALMIVLSTRLILLLLQLDFGPIKNVAKAVYITPFGRWKLYRQYRLNIARRKEIQTAANIYVDLPYQLDGTTREEPLSEWLFNAVTNQRVIVIGAGGLGKTTLCQYVANKAATGNGVFQGKKREPVIIEGPAYNGELLKSIVSSLLERQAYVNSDIVESQLLAGNILVIFDGFSEIRDGVKKSNRLDDIAEFIKDHPDTLFLFTSRSDLTVEIQHALGDAAVVTLTEVDQANLPLFLSKYLKRGLKDAEKLISEIHQSLPNLPPVPLLLSLVAKLYQRTETIPKDEVALYSDYASQLLRRQATGIDEPAGLNFAIRHLVRESFIKSGGDRGFTLDKGIEYLASIKMPLEDRDLKMSPINLLRILSRAGLLRESTEYYRFFHDYFEDYFGARALENDLLNGKDEFVGEAFRTSKLGKTLAFLKIMSLGTMYESKLQTLAVTKIKQSS